MMRWIAVCALFTLSACAKSNDPVEGSQTHFLSSCSEACAAPYECLCGVCTLACEQSSECSEASDDAACVSSAGVCADAARVCDVECSDDDGCSALGESFSCDDGRCRERDDVVAGNGGTSGASGTGGMGGMSGTGGGEPPVMLGDICDGSEAMRFGATSEGGFIPTPEVFANPFGHAYFFIDGQCRYYASSGYREGVFTGTFSDDEEQQLATDFAWSMIAALAAVPEVESCPDAGSNILWAPGYQASCTCGCDESALQDIKEASTGMIYSFIDDLNEAGAGQYLSGPVLAIAFDRGPAMGNEPAWPLDRPVTEIAGFVQSDSASEPFTGTRFDAAGEAEALRALRADVQPGFELIVQDAGIAYTVYVRDDLPEGVEAAIRALRESSTRTSTSQSRASQPLTCWDADALLADWMSSLDGSFYACSDAADCVEVYPELRCDDPSVLIQRCPYAIAKSSSAAFGQDMEQLASSELCPRFEEDCNLAGSCVPAIPACVDSRCVMAE